ncbi:MAG: hypothetical protein PVI54_20950, partial [Desulfobacteraceae bacterium]
TKPFIREFFVEAALAYDTAVIPGDVIEMVEDGRQFIVMNKTANNFEGTAYSYSAVLYKCNVAGVVLRPSNAKVNYKAKKYWYMRISPCYALLTENQYGNELNEDGDVGHSSLKVIDCYVSHWAGIEIGDQFQVSANEYYRVESIALRKFDNVDLITLGEDTRGLGQWVVF